jgi:two-component system, OmpR family, phosphate regulon sensor histidine kinase PhoR
MAFISLAAHELRSPLTSVKGYAQLLIRSARKDPDYPQSHLRALQAIEQQASRMSDMVAELLEASRIQRNVFELHARPADLVALVRHAVEVRRASDEQHQLVLHTPETALVGQFDAAHVEQVMRDLLDNAIRYSPEGGQVTVTVSQVGDAGRVCVHDEGLGVSEEEHEHIFEAFYRGPSAKYRNLSGLGLGLFVSRAIIERQGGRIWLASSEPSQGSEFCFELPLTARA